MLKKGIAIFAIAVMMTTTVAYSSPPNDTGTVVIQKKKTYVYIAPYSGTKYHAKKSCRGLRNARETEKITKKEAKEQGYTACKICY